MTGAAGTSSYGGGTKGGPASYGQHGSLSSLSPNEKTESIYSHSPMVAATALRSSVSVGGATTAPSSISHRADSPSYPSINHITSLHSHDNATLTDSVRQMIYRPDWTTTDEDIDEEKRRRLGEELLQRQLAEDGTMIKQTQPTRLTSMASQIPKARTAIVVAESSDSLSHSSSTNSLPIDLPRWFYLRYGYIVFSYFFTPPLLTHSHLTYSMLYSIQSIPPSFYILLLWSTTCLYQL